MSEDRKYGNDDSESVPTPLSDEELAKLLGDEISDEERSRLVERLHADPQSAEILALAASDVPDTGGGLSSGRTEKLLKLVRESGGAGDICPHCAGDLHPSGIFCPHCGARIEDNPLKCHSCGSMVVEGSAYCPKCGSVFSRTGLKSQGNARFVLLVIGLVSVAVAFAYRAMFFPFATLGLLALGAWGWDLWSMFFRVKKVVREEGDEIEDKGREEEKDQRLTG
jgi:hypothetical protein